MTADIHMAYVTKTEVQAKAKERVDAQMTALAEICIFAYYMNSHAYVKS